MLPLTVSCTAPPLYCLPGCSLHGTAPAYLHRCPAAVLTQFGCLHGGCSCRMMCAAQVQGQGVAQHLQGTHPSVL
jgi:hypothetical protein